MRCSGMPPYSMLEETMARSALTLTEMGEEVCWTLVNQAMGIPDAKMPSDFLTSRVAVLLFNRPSLPERLCVTAAVRQMGGSTVYQGNPAESMWQQEVSSFQMHLFPILGYFLDCLYIYGLPKIGTAVERTNPNFPLINAGCGDSHPAHALADMACMLRAAKSLDGVHAAWIGCANGTLHSLIAATPWFPFSLTVSLPPNTNEQGVREQARALGTPVTFVNRPEDAVKGARFVFAGRKPNEEKPDNVAWALTPELMKSADSDARILLSATPIRAIPVAQELLAGKKSMLVRQAEYRLCVHKRILHWVFGRQ